MKTILSPRSPAASFSASPETVPGTVSEKVPGTFSRSRWLHRYACLTAVATFFLVIAGGLVTSTGSGLAVPDWPLSYGMVFPPMVGGIFYEHGHRMVAGTVGLLTIGLVAWLFVSEPRAWVRRLGLIALAAVVTQAILGGITVLLLLPPAVSIAHACLAQTFFCLVVTIAVVTSRAWIERDGREDDSPAASPAGLAAATVAVVFVQLLLGALMRHTGAGLAIPDFPLAFGRVVPPFDQSGVAVHFAHRVGALAVAAVVAMTARAALRTAVRRQAVGLPAGLLAALVAAQIVLGAFTVWTGKAVAPTTAHVANGALILAVSLVVALLARRRLHAREDAAALSSAAAEARA